MLNLPLYCRSDKGCGMGSLLLCMLAIISSTKFCNPETASAGVSAHQDKTEIRRKMLQIIALHRSEKYDGCSDL